MPKKKKNIATLLLLYDQINSEKLVGYHFPQMLMCKSA